MIWRSPYVTLDTSIILSGIAFTAPVCWQGRWLGIVVTTGRPRLASGVFFLGLLLFVSGGCVRLALLAGQASKRA